MILSISRKEVGISKGKKSRPIEQGDILPVKYKQTKSQIPTITLTPQHLRRGEEYYIWAHLVRVIDNAEGQYP